jgi:putative membrane protein insertion efficiency factor
MSVQLIRRTDPARAVLLAMLRLYQAMVSPVLGPACRFEPTCSAYAMEAIRRFGAVKGSYLAARRILRCHPFTRAGHDPVPAAAPPPARADSL